MSPSPTPISSSTAIIGLKDSDIVCGRGGLANKHPGNRLLRRICNENRTLYQSSMNPYYKQCLILSILTAIQRNGGRFLARTKTGGWNEISDKKAKEKTAQLLRESEDPNSSTTNNKPIAKAAKAAQPTKPAIKKDNNNLSDVSTPDDCLLPTPATKQSNTISPEPVKDLYPIPSSDGLLNLLQQPLLEPPFPDNVPFAESSSSPMLLLDGDNTNDTGDDDLVDSIVEAIETEITSHGFLDAYPNDMVLAVC